MGELPKRPEQHEIDTEACKIVSSIFPRTWEVRELSGRDFGIDRIVENFSSGIATGRTLLLQIKGTEKEIDPTNPKLSIPVKTLLYSELFSTPFILMYCSLKQDDTCYFIWLQEYINVILNFDSPTWREQGDKTIYFSAKSKLTKGVSIPLLDIISKYPFYKSSWFDFYLAMESLKDNIQKIYRLLEEFEDNEFYVNAICIDLLKEMLPKVKEARLLGDRLEALFEPQRELFDRTISFLEQFAVAESTKLSVSRQFFENINALSVSAEIIAQYFSANYNRILYEHDGSLWFY